MLFESAKVFKYSKSIFFFSFFFSLNAWLDCNVKPTLESAHLGSDSVTVYQERKEEKFCWCIRWPS